MEISNINTSDQNNPNGSTFITLVRALKTTIQVNDIFKTKLLDKKHYFSDIQMKVIYENVNLLDDNTLILNQAIQAIKTLLAEIKNLQEIKINESIYTKENFNVKMQNNYPNNVNNNNFIFDSEILNRYNILNKSEEEIKLMETSIKTNLSNHYKYYHSRVGNNNMTETIKDIDRIGKSLKLNYDYEEENFNGEQNDLERKNNNFVNSNKTGINIIHNPELEKLKDFNDLKSKVSVYSEKANKEYFEGNYDSGYDINANTLDKHKKDSINKIFFENELKTHQQSKYFLSNLSF